MPKACSTGWICALDPHDLLVVTDKKKTSVKLA